MWANYKLNYNVDIVFVIDSTGSMGNVIEMVKNNALNFHSQLMESMSQKQKKVDNLRVKIVSFRDYLADEEPMLVTNFFSLPEEAAELKNAVKSISAEGGGDDPEDAMEALAYAIKSKWDKCATKARHIIVLYTDASSHQLGYGKESNLYPKGMPENMSELTLWWDDDEIIKQSSKRLLLFAPDTPDWNFISDNWSNVIHFPSNAGNGLKEIDFKEILSVIANSI